MRDERPPFIPHPPYHRCLKCRLAPLVEFTSDSLKHIIRIITRWAWAEMLDDVAKLEKNRDGSFEWVIVRQHLREAGKLEP